MKRSHADEVSNLPRNIDAHNWQSSCRDFCFVLVEYIMEECARYKMSRRLL